MKKIKRKLIPGVVANKSEEHKMIKYQEACAATGQTFLPAESESQGCAGERSIHHFDRLVMKRVDQIGAPIAAFAVY